MVDGVPYLLRLMAGALEPSPRAGIRRGPAPERIIGLSACLLAACGGAAPLLHPAHVLPVSTVSAGAGVSSQFATDALDDTIERGRAAASGQLGTGRAGATYAEGVLARALVAPGANPWVAARVGLTPEVEAGLTYVGRSLRLDGRYALPLAPAWAVSFGLGASALLFAPDSSSPSPAALSPDGAGAEFELNAKGAGADVPVLIGYESIGGFFEMWGGMRAGFEVVSGSLRSNAADPASARFEASGQRFWGGALAGFALGVPPLWFRFELATTYHRLSGEVSPEQAPGGEAPTEVDLGAWTFAPSGAVVGKF